MIEVYDAPVYIPHSSDKTVYFKTREEAINAFTSLIVQIKPAIELTYFDNTVLFTSLIVQIKRTTLSLYIPHHPGLHPS